MMIGQILADLPVEIVRSEKWIGIIARRMRIDGPMDDAMPFVLGAEQWVTIKDAHIFRLLVGRDDERDEFYARLNNAERIKYLPERSGNAPMFERAFRIELTRASRLA